jgi:murein DD-endopeptidase MepM/ murein hydrolase activator NlpD
MKFLRAYGLLWALVICMVMISGFLSVERASQTTQPEMTRTRWALAANRDRARYDGIPQDDRTDVRGRLPALGERNNTAKTRSTGNASPPEVIAFRPSQVTVSTEAPANKFILPGVLCKEFVSQEQEYAPIQVVDKGAPEGSERLTWVLPVETTTYTAPFSGLEGFPAGHEGIDYVETNPQITQVAVVAAAAGRVVYVRDGCPQSRLLGVNRQLRECGAGWGNHVVVDHGDGLLTRYAHLTPASISVRVGDGVVAGDFLGWMGNTGRSDIRHLHFELGVIAHTLDACAPAQSFDRVYDPETLGI